MGKAKQQPLENRKCSVCLRLEDEYHFVLECQMYVELKKTYISPYFWKKTNMFKLLNYLIQRTVIIYVNCVFIFFMHSNYEQTSCIEIHYVINYLII